MKARVKATGEIVEVYDWGGPTFRADNGNIYQRSNLDFDVEDENNPDYWEKLLHQYAGMAMNALLLTNNIRNGDLEGMKECNMNAMAIATALVEKLKGE